MVQFTTLRLSGFKSFVDQTELEIAPGLTGIVGPNGCGKSNLLEAIRWCMGEGSAKKLRGGGMDDVIFSGSDRRSPRNVAEVTIRLDNASREAPAAYDSLDTIEVIRRIEREQGSAYTINGTDTRARDVQLLFADLSTGAKSAAIVSQGRVAAVINQKPEERRQLLEEAAGITGLHSRRHEAELRLRAAETNLERLEDVVVALEGQMQNLKRQARQATRYRNLSGHIRRAEAMVLHLLWADALAELDAARRALAENADRVATLTAAAAKAATAQTEAAAALPALRARESEAAAALQRLIVERESLDAEEARLRTRQAELAQALEQLTADLARQKTFLAESSNARDRIQSEVAELDKAQQEDAEATRTATDQVARLTGQVQELDGRVTRLTRQVAAGETRRADLDRRIDELSERIALCRRQAEEADTESRTLAAEPIAHEAEMAAEAVAEAEADAEAKQAAADAADASRNHADTAHDRARAAFTEATGHATRLAAEMDALAAVVGDAAEASDDAEQFEPVLTRIEATPGYEAALAAALGDDLDLATDPAAPARWLTPVPSDDAPPPLPTGTRPLADFVSAPTALDRRLAQVAVASDAANAEAAHTQLRQGQRLVTPDGALWRWDGVHVAAGAPTAAETRLKQRNRLAACREEKAAADARATSLGATAEETGETASRAGEMAASAAADLRRTFVALSQARERHDKAMRAAAEQRSRRRILEEAVARLTAEAVDCEARLSEATTARDDLSALEADRDQLAQLRDDLTAERALLGEAQTALNRIAAEADARRRRRAAAETEIVEWARRSEDAATHRDQLIERQAHTEAQIAELAARPAEIETARQALLDAVSEAEARRADAADALAAGENRLKEADDTLKDEEHHLADAREEKGRREGTVAQADQALETVVARIDEKLQCAPDQTLEVAEHKDGAELPAYEDMARKLDRLVRERENMGAVNLRAEQESEELQEQIDSYQSERDDLIQAIEKFRRAIADLNREGKQRLLASFDTVNGHFEDLFRTLFGGGHAHLKLTDMDDPLNAGIEIMASPPGKKLQNLGLLSGGEQALTALSLLFAVFLTNPAPICILDEVDAPLDDSNVDRFCTLVEDIASRTDTRFLIVTHHRMTMARVDRLYGVTMAERGVSQLVSVDLEEAEAMRATA